MLADINRHDLTVSMLCQDIGDQEVATITAINIKGDVAQALSISHSAIAFNNEQRHTERYEPS